MANACRVLQQRPQAAWSSAPLCKAVYVNDFRISRYLGQEYWASGLGPVLMKDVEHVVFFPHIALKVIDLRPPCQWQEEW